MLQCLENLQALEILLLATINFDFLNHFEQLFLSSLTEFKKFNKITIIEFKKLINKFFFNEVDIILR